MLLILLSWANRNVRGMLSQFYSFFALPCLATLSWSRVPARAVRSQHPSSMWHRGPGRYVRHGILYKQNKGQGHQMEIMWSEFQVGDWRRLCNANLSPRSETWYGVMGSR